ncbi:putative holin [Burkholderia sp. MS455]|uniref:putative holin n=1 Tax=Burkholderia sp. MS455 TaxID=2811788 RepID=UPI0019561DCE|nr:putative holin [Burkholderia sp. MS455]
MMQYEAFWQSVSGFGLRNWPHWDLTLVSGVLCGALVFLLRSHEPSWPRKVVYFGVSVVGGFAVTPSVQGHAGLPEWLAAFLTAAAIVTLATVVLDWSEKSVPNLLTQAVQRFIGSSRGHDTTDDGSKQ